MSVGGASKCGGIGGGNCFAFQAPAATAGQLRGLGFDLVNQANNHSLDYGTSGRNQTVAALDRAGVAHTGLPGEITVMRTGGTRVAFIGFAPYASTTNLLDIPAAQALVRRAGTRASLVVVIIHAGAEGAGALHVPGGSEFFLGENRGNPRAFAHAVINAGASIVVGSGPHVVRGIEYYHRRLIAYSLGNFVGYHTLGGGGVLSESGILRVRLASGGRLLAGRWFSVHLNNGLPSPEPSNASAHLAGRLSAEDFPFDHLSIRSGGLFRLPSKR
ncbi:MAG: CapA family protein [Actinomycetota bacterium]|nr:CapA family protein [Actinomycetota bacterium]